MAAFGICIAFLVTIWFAEDLFVDNGTPTKVEMALLFLYLCYIHFFGFWDYPTSDFGC